MEKFNRDRFRAITLGAPKRFPSVIEIVKTVDGEVPVELRMPSIAERQEIEAKATKNGVKDEVRVGFFALIALTFVPAQDDDGNALKGGTVRHFEDEDLENLLAQPVDSWAVKLARKLSPLFHGIVNEEEGVDLGKGSAKTASSDSSPSSP